MKIGFFSDCHCGYKFGEERGEDSFIALEEAIEKTADCDLILIAGDLSDTRIPKQEIVARVAKILSKTKQISSRARLLEVKDKDDVSKLALRGTPVIAIHGNHDRRSKYMVNPVQMLEKAGLLIHLHKQVAIFDVGGEKVAIHGFSAVPERYAKGSLDKWDTKPVEGMTNIFLIHQNITPYIYNPLEPPSLELNDLPPGFDLYILGHIHWSDMKDLHSGKMILAGSTSPISIHKVESEQSKFVYKYFNNTIRKIPLEKNRDIYWEELNYDLNTKDIIANKIQSLSVSDKKPILVVNVKGQVAKNSIPPSFSDLEKKFGDKVILRIKKKFEVEGFDEQVELMRMIREQKLSVREQGLKILEEKLRQNNCLIKPHEIFDLLVEGRSDEIFNVLVKK